MKYTKHIKEKKWDKIIKEPHSLFFDTLLIVNSYGLGGKVLLSRRVLIQKSMQVENNNVFIIVNERS